jgi:hypothetical protein
MSIIIIINMSINIISIVRYIIINNNTGLALLMCMLYKLTYLTI